MNMAHLRRERFFGSDGGYKVKVGDRCVADDGLRVEMGPVSGAWWDVPLPACPDCGGEIVWYEAGYVPGTRKCLGCGSMFSIQVDATTEPPKGPKVDTGPARFSFECDNGHRWQATEAEDKAADHRCPVCGEDWV